MLARLTPFLIFAVLATVAAVVYFKYFGKLSTFVGTPQATGKAKPPPEVAGTTTKNGVFVPGPGWVQMKDGRWAHLTGGSIDQIVDPHDK